jgi:glucose/arabinose dehydrogenase
MKTWLFQRRGLVVIAALVVLAVGAVAIWQAGRFADWRTDTASPAPPTPTPAPNAVTYSVEPVAQGLVVPWSIVFTNDTRALVTERRGTLRVIQDGKLTSTPLARFQVSSRGEEGLMGLALDPDYANNKLVYACYAYDAGANLVDRVVRFEDKGTSAGKPVTILDGIPAATNHAGCRLSFGLADGKLYITTGDASDRAIAQRQDSLGGKILRINANGTIPADNPFGDSPVWSLGHRNPQGLAWQPGTNQLFAPEHGPSGFDGAPGGDEVNVIRKGANYGWPVVSHTKADPRFVSPLRVYTPAIAPGGALFYDGEALPQFKDKLLVAALKGEGVYVLGFETGDRSKVATEVKLPDVNVGRVRDVVQAPDGSIYLLTSNRDGRGTVRQGDDFVYRLTPQ